MKKIIERNDGALQLRGFPPNFFSILFQKNAPPTPPSGKYTKHIGFRFIPDFITIGHIGFGSLNHDILSSFRVIATEAEGDASSAPVAPVLRCGYQERGDR